MRLVVCCDCAAANRVPDDKPANSAKCGRCGSPLFTGKPIDVSARNLKAQIKNSGIPVLVDVWAPWCAPCRMMAPEYESAAGELEPAFRVVRLNSEQEPGISAELGIRGIPTMILFREGREKARVSGAMNAGRITAWARAAAGDDVRGRVT